MSVKITPLPDGRFSVDFPYDEFNLARVKALPERMWNPDDRRWELPVAHLGAIMDIFRIAPTQVDRKLNRAYQMHRIRTARARIVCDNLRCTLTGTRLPLERIDEVTSFFVPGYRFMPGYKSGRWDGKKHLFNDIKGTFPTGLLNRVKPILESVGMECEISPPVEVIHPPILPKEAAPTKSTNGKKAKPFVLRDYQVECIKSALAGKRGVIELATGGGKTAIAAHMIREINQPALFLVHTRDLLHQSRRVFQEMLGIPIGQVGDGKVILEPVTVATIQTCARAMNLKIASTGDDDEKLEKDKTDLKSTSEALCDYLRSVPVAFFDECHHLPAETAFDLAMTLEGASWRYGLSATPYRADRQDMLLESALGPKLYSCRASSLIERGFLVAPRITFRPVPSLVINGAKPEYPQVYQDYVVDNPHRNGMIVAAAEEFSSKGKSVLILVSQVRHGENLRKLMPDVPLVQGADPAEKRQEVFDRLASKEIPVVIATTLADEGLDVPSLNAVILASAGRSETRALQRVGRALRSAPGKKKAEIIDFLDHAPFLKEHAMRRLDIFRSEPLFEVKAPEMPIQKA